MVVFGVENRGAERRRGNPLGVPASEASRFNKTTAKILKTKNKSEKKSRLRRTKLHF